MSWVHDVCIAFVLLGENRDKGDDWMMVKVVLVGAVLFMVSSCIQK